ncbi:transposase [Desulfosporosinus sp.]|uniref:transposase n=1 Tax=Desulfosporosinus sp. TaxID=157907 RepID=UPI00343AB19F
MSEDAFERLENAFGLIPHLSTFLLAFYNVLLHRDVAKLDLFINDYQNDSIEPLSVFVSGLQKDYEAVKNSLLYPCISNGPMEGTNNKIKMVRRRGYGRVGIEMGGPHYGKSFRRP